MVVSEGKTPTESHYQLLIVGHSANPSTSSCSAAVAQLLGNRLINQPISQSVDQLTSNSNYFIVGGIYPTIQPAGNPSNHPIKQTTNKPTRQSHQSTIPKKSTNRTTHQFISQPINRSHRSINQPTTRIYQPIAPIAPTNQPTNHTTNLKPHHQKSPGTSLTTSPSTSLSSTAERATLSSAITALSSRKNRQGFRRKPRSTTSGKNLSRRSSRQASVPSRVVSYWQIFVLR